MAEDFNKTTLSQVNLLTNFEENSSR